MTTGMVLDGAFATEAIDSSGEVFSVKGADITDLLEGKGVANWEHRSHEDVEIPGSEVIGKIILVKKIFSEKDCDNQRELKYWNKIQLPFVYGIVRLYDGAGHPGAQTVASIIRDSYANQEPVNIGWSIEGATLDKKQNTLSSTICRRVAITLKPCNKTALLGLIADPNAPSNFKNFEYAKNQESVFKKLSGYVMEYEPMEQELSKALTAGGGNAAPSTLTQGAALKKEDIKKRLKEVIRKWDKKIPIKAFLKSHMPDISDDYIEHFSNVVEKSYFKVNKGELSRKFEYLTVEFKKVTRSLSTN